jgi:hypothetical protein
MLRERRARLSGFIVCGIGLICLCVIMYMLGSTMTLWSLQFALDDADNPVLEGFSLPTVVSDVTPAMPVMPSREASIGVRGALNEHSLLRPPNPSA